MRLTVPRKLKAIIMGAPGSGKGTIAGRITSNYPQMEHKSSGDLLRGQIEKGTGIAKEAQIYMNEGKVKIKFFESSLFSKETPDGIQVFFSTGGHRCKVRKILLYKVHLLHLYKVHSVFFRENFW